MVLGAASLTIRPSLLQGSFSFPENPDPRKRVSSSFGAMSPLNFRCNDLTVPYPTASFSPIDPFSNHEATGLVVKTNADHIVTSYRLPDVASSEKDQDQQVKREVEVDITPPSLVIAKRRPYLPPMFILNLPGPFKYVSLTSKNQSKFELRNSYWSCSSRS